MCTPAVCILEAGNRPCPEKQGTVARDPRSRKRCCMAHHAGPFVDNMASTSTRGHAESISSTSEVHRSYCWIHARLPSTLHQVLDIDGFNLYQRLFLHLLAETPGKKQPRRALPEHPDVRIEGFHSTHQEAFPRYPPLPPCPGFTRRVTHGPGVPQPCLDVSAVAVLFHGTRAFSTRPRLPCPRSPRHWRCCPQPPSPMRSPGKLFMHR